ncbi:MAG: hypothetical protein Kapaf2KO_13710 [Candidatus Kapaibacteriales bacterium]
MKKILLIIASLGLSALSTEARPDRVNQIPNGNTFSCASCHPGGNTGSLNSFGQDVFSTLNGFGGAGTVDWDAIKSLDSDEDGFTNAQELQDLDMTWARGDANPGDPSLVTAPGDPNSFPASIDELVGDKIKVYYFGGSLRIEQNSYSAHELSVKVIDTKGLTVAQAQMAYGTGFLQLNLDRLSAGNYFVLIKENGKAYYRAFSKAD